MKKKLFFRLGLTIFGSLGIGLTVERNIVGYILFGIWIGFITLAATE